MQFKNIMVHLDSTELCDARVDVAIDLAKRSGARLVGVHAQAETKVSRIVAVHDQSEATKEEARKVVAAFEEKVKAAGLEGTARAVPTFQHGQVVKTVTFAAREADVAVLGQYDEEAVGKVLPEDLAEQVVLRSGRPALVVPYTGVPKTLGQRVLVAWNGSREAARALNDALPVLKAAEEVIVLSINPPKQVLETGDHMHDGVLAHLASHGITAKALHEVNEDISIVNLLLDRLTDHAADMLVMGAHGHYGFPHLLKGGVTRDLLRHLTAPAILSH